MKDASTSLVPNRGFGEPRDTRRLRLALLGVLVLTVLAEALVHLHPHFEVDSVFGFHAGFGFAACAALIVGARALALLLGRADSYYGRRDD